MPIVCHETRALKSLPYPVASRCVSSVLLTTTADWYFRAMPRCIGRKYHRGLLQLALSADVRVIGRCTVQGIERLDRGLRVDTPRGRTKARDVMVATNGYNPGLTSWPRRRVIPVGSYIIATEPLSQAVVSESFLPDRVISDTCSVVHYYRTSPDRRRILFGGRVSAAETNPATSAPELYRGRCRISPVLSQYRITPSWTGTRRNRDEWPGRTEAINSHRVTPAW